MQTNSSQPSPVRPDTPSDSEHAWVAQSWNPADDDRPDDEGATTRHLIFAALVVCIGVAALQTFL